MDSITHFRLKYNIHNAVYLLLHHIFSWFTTHVAFLRTFPNTKNNKTKQQQQKPRAQLSLGIQKQQEKEWFSLIMTDPFVVRGYNFQNLLNLRRQKKKKNPRQLLRLQERTTGNTNLQAHELVGINLKTSRFHFHRAFPARCTNIWLFEHY